MIRVRRSDDRYILTVKSKGLIEREEFELDMDRAEYESLVKKADGNVILKGISKDLYMQRWSFRRWSGLRNSKPHPGL